MNGYILKRQGLRQDNVSYIYVKQFLAENRTSSLQYALYFLNFAPCCLWLFRKIQIRVKANTSWVRVRVETIHIKSTAEVRKVHYTEKAFQHRFDQ